MTEADSAQRVHRTPEIHYEECCEVILLRSNRGCRAGGATECHIIDVELSSRLCTLLYMSAGCDSVRDWLHEQAVG
jgi:hypothetical protein